MAILIKTDGQTLEVTPADKKRGFNNETVYGLLECENIEVVWLAGRMMLIDELGKFRDKPVTNEKATCIAHDEGAIAQSDRIVGNALICSYEEYQ